MDKDRPTGTDPGRAKRIMQRLDQMVARGRVTDEEADRLRSAEGEAAFEEVAGDIRARHVVATLAKRVADGSLSPEEADGLLARVRRGEHSRALADAVHGRRPGADPRPPASGSERTGQGDASS
jgi:hypothetical protein